jgi:hypothetical protein
MRSGRTAAGWGAAVLAARVNGGWVGVGSGPGGLASTAAGRAAAVLAADVDGGWVGVDLAWLGVNNVPLGVGQEFLRNETVPIGPISFHKER